MSKFNPYYKPVPPTPPSPTLTQNVTLKEFSGNESDHISIDHFMHPEATYVRVRPCDEDFDIDICATKVVPNPNYQKELARYEKALAKYNVLIATWTEQKKKYDSEAKSRALKAKKEQFLKLKKELAKTGDIPND